MTGHLKCEHFAPKISNTFPELSQLNVYVVYVPLGLRKNYNQFIYLC